MSIELTNKFIEGLKNYNLTQQDIINNNFHYCGGDKKSHLNYYKLIFKDKVLPEKKTNCICGHAIRENCYITDDKVILTLGNCCIKKFLSKEKSGRTCEKCGLPHKNRVCNMCNECRYGKNCMKCGKEKNKEYLKYKTCYNCYFGK